MKRSQMTSLPLLQGVGSNHTSAGASLHSAIIRPPGSLPACLAAARKRPLGVAVIAMHRLAEQTCARLPSHEGSAMLSAQPCYPHNEAPATSCLLLFSLPEPTAAEAVLRQARCLRCCVGTAAKQKAVSRAPWSQWLPQIPLSTLLSLVI